MEATERVLPTDKPSGPQGYHTFKPEEFPIIELDPAGDPPRTSILGTVFRGHFERRGRPITAEVTATIRKVLCFRVLDVHAKPADDQDLSYLAFVDGDRCYLAHKMVAQPRLGPGPRGARNGWCAATRRMREVRFAGTQGTPADRLVPGRSVDGVSGDHSVTFDVLRETYLEIGELE